MTPDELQKLQELAESIEELKKLAEDIKELKRTRQTIPTIPAVTPVSGRDLIKTRDISSQLDGVIKTFNIGAFHSIFQVVMSSFPHALRDGIDYTYDGNLGTITFTDEIDAATSLSLGQTVRILIITA